MSDDNSAVLSALGTLQKSVDESRDEIKLLKTVHNIDKQLVEISSNHYWLKKQVRGHSENFNECFQRIGNVEKASGTNKVKADNQEWTIRSVLALVFTIAGYVCKSFFGA